MKLFEIDYNKIDDLFTANVNKFAGSKIDKSTDRTVNHLLNLTNTLTTVLDNQTISQGELVSLRADLTELLKPILQSQLELRDAIREQIKLTSELHTKIDVIASYLADEKVRRP